MVASSCTKKKKIKQLFLHFPRQQRQMDQSCIAVGWGSTAQRAGGGIVRLLACMDGHKRNSHSLSWRASPAPGLSAGKSLTLRTCS